MQGGNLVIVQYRAYNLTMKVTAKTEYACVAMMELAAHFGSSEPLRIRRIAERHDVPPRFLVQILLQLKRAGLVASVRGAAGGYQLLKPPQEISLAEIIEVIDGIGEENEHTSSASPDSPAVKVLLKIWREVDAMERQLLQTITLADLLERAKGQNEQMYHI
jgi:Rrf2 family protein